MGIGKEWSSCWGRGVERKDGLEGARPDAAAMVQAMNDRFLEGSGVTYYGVTSSTKPRFVPMALSKRVKVPHTK